MRLALAISVAFSVVNGVALAPGCQGKQTGPAAGSAAGAPMGSAAPAVPEHVAPAATAAAPVVDACGIGSRAIAAAAPCASKLDPQSWKLTSQGFSTVASAVQKSGQEQASQVLCAQMVQAIDADLKKTACTLDLTPDERTQIDGLMTAWYATRTPVIPTGHAASDAVIQRVATARDRMCACADLPCQKEVDATLDLLGSFPADAPKAARDLGDKLIDDIGRCESRLRTLGH